MRRRQFIAGTLSIPVVAKVGVSAAVAAPQAQGPVEPSHLEQIQRGIMEIYDAAERTLVVIDLENCGVVVGTGQAALFKACSKEDESLWVRGTVGTYDSFADIKMNTCTLLTGDVVKFGPLKFTLTQM